MKSKRRIFFCAGTVVLLIAIAAVMMVIGRGHTLYFENTTLEYGGTTYEAPYKVVVEVNGERAASLYAKERGMATWIGQNFQMMVDITQEKGGEELRYLVNLNLPYDMDGIVVNIPAVMAGLPQEAWCSEFVQAIVEEDVEDIDLGDDLGGDGLGEDLGM